MEWNGERERQYQTKLNFLLILSWLGARIVGKKSYEIEINYAFPLQSLLFQVCVFMAAQLLSATRCELFVVAISENIVVPFLSYSLTHSLACCRMCDFY